MGKGRVYLVGAGPGDPALITVRGLELLRQADVVVYDHLVDRRLLAECPRGAALIYAGKEVDHARASQAAINARLIRSAKAGKTVVRLKGGDPFVFGRGGEEALALARAKVSYEVVPGVTSAVAVPAYAGIPLTHRGVSSSVAILTGHEDPAKPGGALRWDRLATSCDTLVCLMGVATLPAIATQLLKHGRAPSTPCAVVHWGTTAAQRTVSGTLKSIAADARQAKIKPPAILIVGQVAALRKQLAWFERRPLSGKRVLVTRSADRAPALAARLDALGASVERLPAIELVTVKPNGAFRDAVQAIPETDWVFFTSPEGIGRFAQLLKPYRKDVRWLSGCHIGAIGPKTAEAIESAGLHVDFVPKRFSQEGVLADLPRRVLAGKRALILSAEASRDVLSDGLRRRGMAVCKVPVYRTVVPRPFKRQVAAIFSRPFDAVTVTSASCVEHLHAGLSAAGKRSLFRRLPFASIGPVTSAAVRARGGRVAVEASVSTIEGLVDAIAGAAR